ncbi:RimK-like ATPgrasp N-terminal domain-containing protein [bacterium]|nr:RimK-like ATPgrasp N-terminal domain-containing protein [bacterium]
MEKKCQEVPLPFLESPISPCVAWYEKDQCYLNLAGIYNYLELPYYVSQDYENSGHSIHPTCKEMLDAYVPPLFLEKAKLAGLDVPDFYISNGFFEPPVIIDPINPFITKGRIVWKSGREDSIAKSMTRNHTYAICCQEIPLNSKVAYFRSVLGWCVSGRFRDISLLLWQQFQIPLAKVRLIITPDGRLLLSDISPLLLESLGVKERTYLEENIQWVK